MVVQGKGRGHDRTGEERRGGRKNLVEETARIQGTEQVRNALALHADAGGQDIVAHLRERTRVAKNDEDKEGKGGRGGRERLAGHCTVRVTGVVSKPRWCSMEGSWERNSRMSTRTLRPRRRFSVVPPARVDPRMETPRPVEVDTPGNMGFRVSGRTCACSGRGGKGATIRAPPTNWQREKKMGVGMEAHHVGLGVDQFLEGLLFSLHRELELQTQRQRERQGEDTGKEKQKNEQQKARREERRKNVCCQREKRKCMTHFGLLHRVLKDEPVHTNVPAGVLGLVDLLI